MGDLISGLIVLLLWFLIIPIILLALLLALAAAGVGIAIGLAAAAVGIALHLIWWALPFLVVFGLIWLIFRPSGRQVARH